MQQLSTINRDAFEHGFGRGRQAREAGTPKQAIAGEPNAFVAAGYLYGFERPILEGAWEDFLALAERTITVGAEGTMFGFRVDASGIFVTIGGFPTRELAVSRARSELVALIAIGLIPA
jgi:hypothetical protein